MENIAKKYADWCWGKTIPTEVGEIEKFFNRFLKEVDKKPIFVTEDGVEMFKGDSYCKVNNHSDFSLVAGFVAEGAQDKHKGLKFSTKEAAEKYIRDNRPQYSLNDVVEAVNVWSEGITAENVLYFFQKRGENE